MELRHTNSFYLTGWHGRVKTSGTKAILAVRQLLFFFELLKGEPVRGACPYVDEQVNHSPECERLAMWLLNEFHFSSVPSKAGRGCYWL
jgi:hypothetical protein